MCSIAMDTREHWEWEANQAVVGCAGCVAWSSVRSEGGAKRWCVKTRAWGKREQEVWVATGRRQLHGRGDGKAGRRASMEEWAVSWVRTWVLVPLHMAVYRCAWLCVPPRMAVGAPKRDGANGCVYRRKWMCILVAHMGTHWLHVPAAVCRQKPGGAGSMSSKVTPPCLSEKCRCARQA